MIKINGYHTGSETGNIPESEVRNAMALPGFAEKRPGKGHGSGWKRRSRVWIYERSGVFTDSGVNRTESDFQSNSSISNQAK